MFDFIKNISPTELVIILVVVVLFFFGGKVVKGFARTSGETLREIKGIKKGFTEAFEDDVKPSKSKS